MDNTSLTGARSPVLSLKFTPTFVKPHLMTLPDYNGKLGTSALWLANADGPPLPPPLFSTCCVGMHTLCA